ncbi:peptidoglycan-binding protein [Streptomyces sp. NPDC004111]|uniref:peptidoglycan-binding domain-containing protein n=1 Tax=Streptomyces sp. NPDC004111 TaxID=3364690 RepID=UPI0036B61A42
MIGKKLLTAALGLGLLIVPLSATAATAKPGDCHWLTQHGVYCEYYGGRAVIGMGSSGPAVREAQALLKYRGYSVGSTGVDGEFGSATDTAVRKFQKKLRLTADGLVGEKTWYALRTGIAT